MAEGRTNSSIAGVLFVTEGAVEKHVTNIFAKLGLPPADQAHRRVLAVLRYLEHGSRRVTARADRTVALVAGLLLALCFAGWAAFAVAGWTIGSGHAHHAPRARPVRSASCSSTSAPAT